MCLFIEMKHALLCFSFEASGGKCNDTPKKHLNLAMFQIFIVLVSSYSVSLKGHKPFFPAETFPMGFNQHKPVLE